jgi:hypothetical protein
VCGRLIELPWTEVCMHLGIAGRLRWVVPVNDRLAQVYDPAGRVFSAPILRSEAGID